MHVIYGLGQCQGSVAVVTLAANPRAHQLQSRHSDVQGSSDVIAAVPEFTAEWPRPVTDSQAFSGTPRLIIPRTHTELAKRAFFVSAPALWNSLPVDVIDANSLLSLKKQRAYLT